jgi:rubrerythrin
MAIDVSSLNVEKALSMALKAEKESAKMYQKLKEKVNNFVMKEKLQFLIKEEKKHQQILESLFNKLYPDKKPSSSEKSLIPRIAIALKEDMAVPDLLELAMDAEKTFEEYYDDLSQEVMERGVQEILQYLTSMEHGHYALLKGEYDLCIRDEQYYEREDFQYDMVHIGP